MVSFTQRKLYYSPIVCIRAFHSSWRPGRRRKLATDLVLVARGGIHPHANCGTVFTVDLVERLRQVFMITTGVGREEEQVGGGAAEEFTGLIFC